MSEPGTVEVAKPDAEHHEAIRLVLENVHDAIMLRAQMWAGRADEHRTQLFVPSKAKKHAMHSQACALRTDECVNISKILEGVIEQFGGKPPEALQQ